MVDINVESFIKDIYCRAHEYKPIAFRQWALNKMTLLFEADAAFWGTGSYQTYQFHSFESLGLDEFYGEKGADLSLSIKSMT